MPFRISRAVCFAAPLLVASLPATAQSDPSPMRTVDIPPSHIEPQEGLELDLMRPGGSIEASVTTPDAPEAAPAPSAEQVALDAIAAAEAAKLRAANAAQLTAAQAQLQQITADRRAQQDRLTRYQEKQAAHAAAMSDYAAQLAAARADRERWEANVAACRAGDRSRCAPPANR